MASPIRILSQKVGRTLKRSGRCRWRAVLLLIGLCGSKLWAQGPPFQVDDPVPVDFKHYEFYISGSPDGTPAETDYSGPGAVIRLRRGPVGRAEDVELV